MKNQQARQPQKNNAARAKGKEKTNVRASDGNSQMLTMVYRPKNHSQNQNQKPTGRQIRNSEFKN